MIVKSMLLAFGLPLRPGVCHPASVDSTVVSSFAMERDVSPVEVFPGLEEAMVGKSVSVVVLLVKVLN